MKQRRISIAKSSGNVFKDLGYSDLEAEEMLAKANLASKINEIIHKRDLTQKEAARILRISQPNVSLLSRGILKEFSIDRLMKFLSRLNQDVEIVIHERPYRKSKKTNTFGHISVVYV